MDGGEAPPFGVFVYVCEEGEGTGQRRGEGGVQ